MKTIVIDPGHGGADPGAVNGTRLEKTDNLRLALIVRDILRGWGENAVLTREGDAYVPLIDRSYISNAAGADAFISLHRNSSANPSANGTEVYVQTGSAPPNAALAKDVHDLLIKAGVQSDRGILQANFSVLRNTAAPAALIETGFISNAADNALYDEKLYAYADTVARGVMEFLGEKIPNGGAGTPASPAAPSGGEATVREIQSVLNNRYNAGLTADGRYGVNTRKGLIRGVQSELNRLYNAGLSVDGVWGAKTKAAVRSLKNGDKGNLVWLLQALLYVKGYGTYPDGAFGPKTLAAVKKAQADYGLTADGIAGGNTFAALV